MLGKISVIPIDKKSTPGEFYNPSISFLIEGTENVKIYIERKKEIQLVPGDLLFGRLLCSFGLGLTHYVVLSDNCLYNISDWPTKTILELVNCRDYARFSPNIHDLRTFLEL